MSTENWGKTAGNIFGKIIGLWFGITLAALVLVVPIKATVWLLAKVWGLW